MDAIKEKIWELMSEHVFPMLIKYAPTLIKSARGLHREKMIKDNPNLPKLEELAKQGPSGATLPLHLQNPTEFDNLINKGIENKGEPIDLNKTVKRLPREFQLL